MKKSISQKMKTCKNQVSLKKRMYNRAIENSVRVLRTLVFPKGVTKTSQNMIKPINAFHSQQIQGIKNN